MQRPSDRVGGRCIVKVTKGVCCVTGKIRLSIQLAALGLVLLLVTQCMPSMGMTPVKNVPSQETASASEFTPPIMR